MTSLETYNRPRVKGDFRTTRENIARFLELKKTTASPAGIPHSLEFAS
jgi:hypothetical protein